jgi:hypothetical protein
MTWDELVAEVRAQIDVDVTKALAWLLDRARVLNAEAAWLLSETQIPAVTGTQEYALPTDLLRTEAVLVGGIPYRRRTLSQMDEARAYSNPAPIYADAAETADRVFAINPPPGTGATIVMRYLADIPVPTNTATESPPFPPDITPILADGAIGQGLARMDERFDSAGYFDARFVDGIQRLRRRRNSRAGRGGTPIRISRG